MISCFNNLIGIKDISGFENPDSGYFINDLEGITTQKVEDISDNTDHYEPRLAWNDIYDRSTRLIENDIKTSLRRYYRNVNETENNITSQIQDNTPLAQGQSYNGWLFDLGYRSKNRRLRFNKIGLYLQSATEFSIYIFDASTGDQLDKITFSGTKGLNEYRILKSYPVWKYRNIFIAYDASEVSTLRSDLYNVSIGNVFSGSVDKSSSVLSTSIRGGDTGMMLNYSWECSVDNFVCQRIELFTDPFLYKLGVEFCKELLHSSRINRFTLLDKATAEELKESFQQEYDRMMDNIFNDIIVSDFDECFECAKELTFKQSLP